MSMPQNVIAIVFDFDDTLTDDSTTKLLAAHGFDAEDFWRREMKALTDDGWDSPLAYLTLILENVGEGKRFGALSNASLRQFGATLAFYEGIPQLFGDLQDVAKRHTLTRPAINKGITDEDMKRNPFAVNTARPNEDRRVPFQNMIYIGDGLTDVPCFSVVEKAGGTAFGVFDPIKAGSPKKAWENLVAPKRVSALCSPRYGDKEILGSLLRAAVSSKCVDIDLRTQSPLRR
jgi:phosphoglycolate phosphatase-like HAD superfamily hydrolase